MVPENSTDRNVPLETRIKGEARIVAGEFSGIFSYETVYLCTHNAGRSLMAAAFTAHLGKDRVWAMSAGATPAGEVNAVAVQAMGELGIDILHRVENLLNEICSIIK